MRKSICRKVPIFFFNHKITRMNVWGVGEGEGGEEAQGRTNDEVKFTRQLEPEPELGCRFPILMERAQRCVSVDLLRSWAQLPHLGQGHLPHRRRLMHQLCLSDPLHNQLPFFSTQSHLASGPISPSHPLTRDPTAIPESL